MDDMSINSIASKERIFCASSTKARIGVSLNSLSIKGAELIKLIELHKDLNHVLVVDSEVNILLKAESTEDDILFAYCHAIYYHEMMSVEKSL